MPEDDRRDHEAKGSRTAWPARQHRRPGGPRLHQLLTDSIDKEKEEHGKGADAIYRDLKILKAALESMTADMKAKLDKIYAVRRVKVRGST